SYYFMGKDNIVFHSQIWPAELLGYNGQGSRAGLPGVGPGELGVLDLPTEVVSSEFLTMEGRKFSSSHGIVIYVRDFLERYQADALRYFICAAGPETADADFTWAEFVRRTNGELVAGWGNLVNRTATMIHKRFGQIPEPGPLEAIDSALLDSIEAGFADVGGLIARHRQKAALAEAMRLVGEANKYIADTEPFKLKAPEQQERLATVLHTLAQAVADLNLMLSPFLPHAANDVDRVLGGSGRIAPMPRIEEVAELDPEHLPEAFDGRTGYPIITGDYQDAPTWGRHPVTVGTPVAKPTPVFTKLDESIVEAELARYAGSVPDDVTGS
ncbi:MAG: methionine--tRNA ligase, partial [Actinomyces sp.]